MRTKLLLTFIIIAIFSLNSFAQHNCTYNTRHFAVGKHNSVNVAGIKTDWNVQLLNLDNPIEGNKAYAEHIEKIKKQVEAKYPKKENKQFQNFSNAKFTADTPVVVTAFEGNLFENNIPNDNTLAASNGGMLISAINSNIYFFDTANDTLLKTVALSTFSDTLNLYPDQYDPKLLYDPNADKFIIVYLAGFLDSTSNIIIGFSQTNDPLGDWNLYYLPGNPLNDTSWTDFPAIALTENELFITVNLLKNDESWQLAFKQSIIWQIDKNKGFSGDTLRTKLWHNINFNNKPLRNLHPIQGGSGLAGPDIYLMNTRNFAVQNDTMFLMHLSNVQTDTNATLTVTPLISDNNYGMPPDAKQPQNQKFSTNDARVLAGFIENDKIQFVGNTVDTLTGFATMYHGIINDVSTSPSLHLTLMTDTVEFGYPNISYTGNDAADNSAFITVNYTGEHTFPGFCAFNYNGYTGLYSSRGNLKSGVSFVNLMAGTDRWGDYSGSQRVYNEPGKVWACGSFGKHPSLYAYRMHGTWIVKLQKPAPDAGITAFANMNADLLAYPNPVSDVVFVELSIAQDAVIDVILTDNNGKLVRRLLHGPATVGKNLFSFSTRPLAKGIYFLNVKDSKNIFLVKKIVKE